MTPVGWNQRVSFRCFPRLSGVRMGVKRRDLQIRKQQKSLKNEACQRSFNWQSTAFVMRGLWVRLRSLALVHN